MNKLIRYFLVIISVLLLISSLAFWFEFQGDQSNGIRMRRGSVFILFFQLAPYVALPAIGIAAANLIGGRPFLPEKFLRNMLYFLAVALVLSTGWEFFDDYLRLVETGSDDGESILLVMRSMLWPLTTTALALFFAQQFYVDDDRP